MRLSREAENLTRGRAQVNTDSRQVRGAELAVDQVGVDHGRGDTRVAQDQPEPFHGRPFLTHQEAKVWRVHPYQFRPCPASASFLSTFCS